MSAVLCGDSIRQSQNRQILQQGKDWLHTHRKGSQTAGYPNYCRSVRQCRLSNYCPFCFRRVSTKQQENGPDLGVQEKEKSLGLREMTKKNSLKGAGTDLHLQTGHLLPRTGGFPDAQLIEDHWGGGNPNTVGGNARTSSTVVTSSLSLETGVKRTNVYAAGAREGGLRGWGSC